MKIQSEMEPKIIITCDCGATTTLTKAEIERMFKTAFNFKTKDENNKQRVIQKGEHAITLKRAELAMSAILAKKDYFTSSDLLDELGIAKTARALHRASDTMTRLKYNGVLAKHNVTIAGKREHEKLYKRFEQ